MARNVGLAKDQNGRREDESILTFIKRESALTWHKFRERAEACTAKPPPPDADQYDIQEETEGG